MITEFFGKLFFPSRCLYCNRVIGFSGTNICDKCAPQIKAVKRPCGLAIQKYGREMQFITAAYAPLFYERPAKNAILRMKFGKYTTGIRELADGMAMEWNASEAPPVDCLLAVPCTKKERKGRRCNLPQMLAEILSVSLGVPLWKNILYKQRETPRQMGLAGAARRKNVKDAYAVTDAALFAGKTVLLIDDVLTTGSTLNECAKTICGAGAAACYTLTIAVTK
ncbi:MAG: phosphoribosyltransferase family protein [Ruthenibacterium sp.]